MGRKWTDKQYYVQDNADVEHRDVKMYFNTSKSPELLFFGPHSKPHGARRLSKHHHLRFDTKKGEGYMCNFPHIMCLFCMYINARQTLNIWYTTI